MTQSEMTHPDSKELSAYQAHLQELLATTQERFGIPGIALELCANGVRVRAAMGTQSVDDPLPIGKEARFEVGALSKVLLTTVTLELAAMGKLSLDSPVGNLLPEFEATRFGEQVTLWHLLCHSGGYKSVNLFNLDVQQRFSWHKLVSFLRDVPFLFEPGTVFSYTVCHYAANSALTESVPYTVVLVSLDDAPSIRVVGNLDGTDVTIGMPVVATWEERTAEDGTVILLPQWVRA